MTPIQQQIVIKCYEKHKGKESSLHIDEQKAEIFNVGADVAYLFSNMIYDAMDEFGKLKWSEACEAQKKICSEQETPRISVGGIETWNVFTDEEKKLILDSPKAEYE